MLSNPGFEGISRPGGWTRDCHDGIEHPEIYSAEGWTAWHNPDLDHPEMHVIQLVPPFIDPPRIAEGDWAVKLFKSFSKVDAGLYQVVEGLTPGATYAVGFKAHAWCLHDGLPHFGNAHCSVIGCGAQYWDEAAIPPQNGDPVNDAIGAALFSVGVSSFPPNPFQDVMWNARAAIYNVYQNVPELIFHAQSDTVVIYLRAELIWAYRNNDVYLDSVYMHLVDDPPSGECKGLPRIDYSSAYNVIPKNATEQRAVEIFTEAWRRGKENVGGSYDAPGVGDFSSKIAKLHDIEEEKKQNYLNFYAEHYPGTKVEFLGSVVTPPSELKLTYPATHMPWVITQHFHAGHSALDIRASYEHFNGDLILCALSGEVIKAGWGGGTFGYQVMTRTTLADGRIVEIRYAHMLEDLYVSVGHRVIPGEVLGKAGGTGDPPVADHLHISVFVIDGNSRRYVDPEPLIQWPDNGGGDEPNYPTPGEFLSLHIQNRSGGDIEYIQAVQPEWVKLVLNMQWAREWIKPVSPNTKVLFRWFTDQYDAYLKHPDGLRAGARLYLEQSLDSLKSEADYIDAMEGTNELIGTGNPDDIRIKVEFECHFADHLYNEMGDAVAPCLLNPGVGNPDHGYEASLLSPAAEQVVRYNGYLGGHSYIGFRYVDRYCSLSDAARHFSMRPLLSWDPEFRAKGIYPQYILTEGGGIYIHPTAGMPSSGAGWRYKDTCKNDWDWNLEGKMELRRQVAEWNALHGNRCRGLTEFTWPGSGKWEYFGANREQLGLQRIAVT